MKQIEIKIIAAASSFAHGSRKVCDLADKFDVDSRTIRRWSVHELWDRTLDTMGYCGVRTFEHQPNRDVSRDTKGLFDAAREAYLNAAAQGEPRHKLAHIAADSVGVSTRKVRDWAKKYHWRKTDGQKECSTTFE